MSVFIFILELSSNLTYGILSMKHLTFKQYRRIDLAMLCGITAIFEAIATLASTQWFVLQAMTVSIVLTMVCITMMRWGKYAILPAFVGSFVYCLASNATIPQFIIYCGGSLFCLLPLPLLLILTKDKVRTNIVIRSVFVLETYLVIAVGRWLCSLPFNLSIETLSSFIFTDVLSLLFAVVVMSLAKNADGLIEDQRDYLIRIEEERLQEQKTNLNNPF